MIPTWTSAIGATALALAVGGACGVVAGAKLKQGEWDREKFQRQRETLRQLEVDADRSRAASAEFEAWRRDQALRQAKVAKELRDALQRPISCPASGLVADVVVPAAAVERLRDAGAAVGAAGAAR